MNYNYLKKIFDLIFSIFSLIIFFPLMLIISLIIFSETLQVPWFIQERGLSLSNQRFRIYKFRTLKKCSNKIYFTNHLSLKKQYEKNLVTNFSKFLRKTGLDELPQLINIIKGEMSLIGPRPLALNDIETLREYYPDYYKRRDELKILPGLSGLWQLNKGNDYSLKNLVSIEKFYLQNRSLALDALIFLKSIKIMLTAKNIDSILE